MERIIVLYNRATQSGVLKDRLTEKNTTLIKFSILSLKKLLREIIG